MTTKLLYMENMQQLGFARDSQERFLRVTNYCNKTVDIVRQERKMPGLSEEDNLLDSALGTICRHYLHS